MSKEVNKILKRMRQDSMKDPEQRLEIKLNEFKKPVTLSELSKKYRKNKAETLKVVKKLIGQNVISLSLTPSEKFMKTEIKNN